MNPTQPSNTLNLTLFSRMLSSGCYSNCRDLLLDKNERISTAAIELLANLSLSDQVSRFTSFTLELDIMRVIFQKNNLKQRFAIVTFIANTIYNESVKSIIASSHELIGQIVASLAESDVNMEYAHRVMVIMDELKEEEEAVEAMRNPNKATRSSI